MSEFKNQMANQSLVNQSIIQPIEQFQVWFAEAQKKETVDPVAMSLATATVEGAPSVRIVLFKGILDDCFSFYTNYDSRKGHELLQNPQASLAFYWHNSYRQVRIDGSVRKMSAAQSDKYFASRPRDSQIGAHASKQSSILSTREELEKKVKEFETKFSGIEVPRPSNWGGYLLEPKYFEFWQGRESRLHERLVFKKASTGWKSGWISP